MRVRNEFELSWCFDLHEGDAVTDLLRDRETIPPSAMITLSIVS
jgi:hypothetical protein